MIRKPYFSLFLLCLPLFSLCSSGNDDPAPAPAPGKEWLDPIRVATYNIQYDNSSDQDNKWTTRRDLLRQLLQSEKFDIFGAQEPYLTQIKDIEPFLDGYTWVGENVIGDKTAQRRHYNPVFYRKDKFEVLDMGSFWYSETPSAPGSKGWDSYSPRMCNWVHFRIRANGREFYHFNSHFDHIGTTARAESAKLLVAKVREIAGGKPAFCTGDFNSNQNTEAYKTIAGSGILADSYVRCPSKTNGDWPTYNGYKYISTPPAAASRIDHVLRHAEGHEGRFVAHRQQQLQPEIPLGPLPGRDRMVAGRIASLAAGANKTSSPVGRRGFICQGINGTDRSAFFRAQSRKPSPFPLLPASVSDY